jgi:Flp pilus assembly protein TadG
LIVRFKTRRLHPTTGGALIEFSLVVSMLMFILFGVVEISRMLLVYAAIADAARAGERYAVVHGHDRSGGTGADGESGPANNPTQVLTVVKDFASTGLLTLSNSNITVTYSPSNTPGSVVTVKVVYTYTPLVGYFNTSLEVPLGTTSQGVITF